MTLLRDPHVIRKPSSNMKQKPSGGGGVPEVVNMGNGRCTSQARGCLILGMVMVAAACSSDPDEVQIQAGYAHVVPTIESVPQMVDGELWKQHWVDDIQPYWMMPEAFGTPEGNFPTFRGMDGSIQGGSERYPRMIARQTYTYAVGYMLTGEERLLELSRAGAYWLLEHAWDEENGGFHALLYEDGTPRGREAKTAQDLSYGALGLTAYYFVSRDPAMEPVIIASRDLLMSGPFWDADDRRIKDGMNADLTREVDVENDNGWELVALLDPVNAFMLLSQPIMSEQATRDQFMNDLQLLAELMIEHFYSDGLFWGVHNKQGQYNTRHTDYGHTLKTYWMILQIDKRLDGHPFFSFLQDNVHAQVERALDTNGRQWNQRPNNARLSQRGSDWWVYAEANQLTATLNFIDYRYTDTLAQTQATWLNGFVDDREIKEIVPQINRAGRPARSWGNAELAKCNQWKNGFHSSEHALIMYLSGKNLSQEAATLYFAVPEAEVDTFVARPYLFEGQEVAREASDTIVLGEETHRKVAVSFDQLF